MILLSAAAASLAGAGCFSSEVARYGPTLVWPRFLLPQAGMAMASLWGNVVVGAGEMSRWNRLRAPDRATTLLRDKGN